MPRHHDPLMSFDVPRDWEDRSMVAYTAPLRAEQNIASNLVLTRDRLDGGEDLAGYADRHVAELAGQLKDFVLRKREDVEIDGRPGVALAFASRGPGASLEQRLTMVDAGEGQVAVLTLTAPRDDVAMMGPLFQRILDSIAVGDGSGGEHAGSEARA